MRIKVKIDPTLTPKVGSVFSLVAVVISGVVCVVIFGVLWRANWSDTEFDNWKVGRARSRLWCDTTRSSSRCPCRDIVHLVRPSQSTILWIALTTARFSSEWLQNYHLSSCTRCGRCSPNYALWVSLDRRLPRLLRVAFVGISILLRFAPFLSI